MLAKLRSKASKYVILAVRGLMVGLGVVSAPHNGLASAGFDSAASQNTVEAYTSFILGGGNIDEVDKAFCLLRDLDSSSADQVATDFVGSTTYDAVDFATCASTGSARLTII